MRNKVFCLISGDNKRDLIVFTLIVVIYTLLLLLAGAKSFISALITSIFGMAMAYVIIVGSIYITDKMILPSINKNKEEE